MDFWTTKECAGSYVRTDGSHKVDIKYFDHLHGWIAQATWDHFLMTDPVPTKREAVLNADHMLLSKAA